MFYCHPSQERIVLSHALFLVMTASIKGKISKEKYLLLLRKYQEEMLDAWLTESSYFNDLLHYCNVIYNILPIVLQGGYNLSIDKDARVLLPSVLLQEAMAVTCSKDKLMSCLMV